MDDAFNDIVKDIFKRSEVRDEMGPAEIPEWDSMNYLKLIAALEERFMISFTMNEVVSAKTIGDIRKAVQARER